MNGAYSIQTHLACFSITYCFSLDDRPIKIKRIFFNFRAFVIDRQYYVIALRICNVRCDNVYLLFLTSAAAMRIKVMTKALK